MTPPQADNDRFRRVRDLLEGWRKREPARDDPSRSQGDEATQRRSDTLASNDRIRGEAPDDLETRRRADQLEREIKRSDRDRGR